ncbi:acetyltransferase [Phenylobacterium sp.]|jgi:sugar O-acyltransferase (sialic acid O-acetyltransferase NeuD family)|uniref:acetyltransferase n=1 Tax=Phenylobacterium sp. TaxID=1871053 RepID=UPI002E34C681|nr:acetyltransferase [Phenylobacterium sp.]HEX2559894.1 acetyltransferase [Phenylobacterium sp.]
MKPLVMVGAGPGSLPRIIAEAAAARGAPLAGYLDAEEDPQPPTTPIPRLGDQTLLEDAGFLSAHDLVLGVQGRVRRALAEAILARGGRLPVIVHPAATVSTTARIGDGTILSAGVIVQSDTRIGRLCVLNTACTVDHDNLVGDEVSIAPGAHTAGRVTIQDGAFIGLGAVIINNVVVGARATVGAGAVVTRDVPEGATVVGNPARVLPKKDS